MKRFLESLVIFAIGGGCGLLEHRPLDLVGLVVCRNVPLYIVRVSFHSQWLRRGSSSIVWSIRPWSYSFEIDDELISITCHAIQVSE